MNTFIKASFKLIFPVLALFTVPAPSVAETKPYKVSGPLQHKNLTVYLIHGENQFETENVLTLAEALEKKKIIVHETGNVGELSVENISDKETVFIQAGDIVKGGRQDRALSKDLVLQPKSGKVPLESFCVEQGRWSARGPEDSTKFSSAKNRLSSKPLKVAAQHKKEQGEVWSEVSRSQQKLGKNLGQDVTSAVSASSLQLTLENKKLIDSARDYEKALQGAPDGHNDAIGYIFAINGELNSAEVYGANGLFKKMWATLLNASASEAIAEADMPKVEKTYSETELLAFLDDAEQGTQKFETNDAETKRESKQGYFYESRKDAKSGKWMHRSYIKK